MGASPDILAPARAKTAPVLVPAATSVVAGDPAPSPPAYRALARLTHGGAAGLATYEVGDAIDAATAAEMLASTLALGVHLARA